MNSCIFFFSDSESQSGGGSLHFKSSEDLLSFAVDLKADLRRIVLVQELRPDDRKMQRLLSAVLYLLLQRNRFDCGTLKQKLFSGK